jgi:hypothetical protein
MVQSLLTLKPHKMDETMIQLIAMKDAQIQALTKANDELNSQLELVSSNTRILLEKVKVLYPGIFDED